jgi:hypothetical protein
LTCDSSREWSLLAVIRRASLAFFSSNLRFSSSTSAAVASWASPASPSPFSSASRKASGLAISFSLPDNVAFRPCLGGELGSPTRPLPHRAPQPPPLPAATPPDRNVKRSFPYFPARPPPPPSSKHSPQRAPLDHPLKSNESANSRRQYSRKERSIQT